MLNQQQIDFAQNWAKYPDNPLKAALAVLDSEGNAPPMGEALRMSVEWVKNEEVVKTKNKFTKFPIDGELPNRDQFIAVVWDRLNQTMSHDEFTRMAKLFSDLSKFTDTSQKIEIETVSMSPEQMQNKIDELLERRNKRTI